MSDSPWNQFWTALGLGPKDSSADFTVTQFGTFTANFEKLPPPIPEEYLIPLYGIIVSTVVGWSIPSIIGGIRTKRQEKRLYSIHMKINLLWDDGRLDLDDIEPLEKIIRETEDAYAGGKINNEKYTSLKNEISVLYEEIFKKRIDSQQNPIGNREVVMAKIKEDLGDVYAKGKLNQLHYDLLNSMISDYEGNR